MERLQTKTFKLNYRKYFKYDECFKKQVDLKKILI
jgi:hypothetical protein